MTQQNPRTRFIIFFGFVMFTGVFRLEVFMLESRGRVNSATNLDSIRPILYGMAGLALLSAAGYALFTLPRALTSRKALTNTILSLALSESCSIFGMLLFFLGGASSEVNRFIGGTLAVDFLFILPFMLRG